ncbi:DUF934 domain-containing protein [Altererythrobacter sp. TH136]|uniref:DUF934 domain-containing protein n=1 Tax=Altererythrobacter sp. TH136 TaxID=2067415 RepID=UPI0011626D27|nr:DUF934 domain-containing protein [Altererythrobacter sp. TH136]QDM41653.1 DUF934 domain-containing protein [Altererythrobacter sp. TH136]
MAESGNPTPAATEEYAAGLRFRDDVAADEPAVSLDAFLEQDEAVSVRIEAGEDVTVLYPHLSRVRLVEVDFPKFRDGRGFSTARMLREAGYTGEIKATGDVLVDLIFFMRRCGFDSFAPDKPIDPRDAEIALTRWDHVYVPAADDRIPIWRLRHG